MGNSTLGGHVERAWRLFQEMLKPQSRVKRSDSAKIKSPEILKDETAKQKEIKMNAIESMSADHRVIENVIKTRPMPWRPCDQGRRIEVQKLRGVVEFLRIYADRRHHQREEGIFFPFLVSRACRRKGAPSAG